MAPTSIVKGTLGELGLRRAVADLPGLLAIVVVVFVLLEALARTFGTAGLELPEASLNVLLVVLALLLGLTGYYAGNFWDDRVFDPLYGPGGRWIYRTRRPLGVFIAGEDLQGARDAACRRLLPRDPACKGLYRAAQDALVPTPNAELRRVVQGPLILSKMVRSFLWPLLATAVLCAIWGGAHLATARPASGARLGVAAAGLVLLGTVLLIPYLNLRVEHLIRLYRATANPPTAA
jgi:hypothetical protein